ncbi:Transposase InsO and inactivated derivatives [Geodermatophilus africanus]|uniref:Transposase InsO and inactivated derivatives n=1 Tax=Geodermatophilus africanus TaxID=1137993 RepID=A0A1H3R495_9ACTN|nr:IS3 family transposase [Geodermatophilus africanus]SDZ20470.1 Transposase InsO and inactivated derivatives [Geodermatophilus africanus]
MTRFQFVADHRDAFEVKRMCRLLDVHRSAFYAWEATAPARAARAAAEAELAQRIRAVHADHRANRAYGAPRITAELNDGAPDSERGEPQAGRPRDGRAQDRRDPVAPAGAHPIGEPAGQQVPDLLERDFTAAAPNVKYVGDITYLPCGEGMNLYLATVIDCYSRRLVGWSIADHMRTELVADALLAAAATRGSLAGAIFHSDHGGQYSARAFAQLCDHLGVVRSMGAVGYSADNALAESFNATLKRETLAGAAGWDSPAHARRDVFGWITRYNSRRRHSACGQTSPTVYEAGWAPARLPTAA